MKNRKVITIAMYLLLSFGGLHAQSVVLSGGGEATGTSGTLSYSVGQVVYTSYTDENSSVVEGVQQTYMISLITGSELLGTDVELKAYPNPATNFITLSVRNYEERNLIYLLYNSQGQLFEANYVVKDNTTISMGNLPSSIYFLKITNGNSLIKTFKIIKN